MLYVCDRDNHRIQIVDWSKGTFNFTKFYGLDCPTDIALNKDKDQLFITDQDNNGVYVVNIDGSCIGVFGINMKDPFGICTYVKKDWHEEFVLVSYPHYNFVYMFKVDGTLFSRHNDSSYEFDYPCGVAMMNDEQMVVASRNGDRLTGKYI